MAVSLPVSPRGDPTGASVQITEREKEENLGLEARHLSFQREPLLYIECEP